MQSKSDFVDGGGGELQRPPGRGRGWMEGGGGGCSEFPRGEAPRLPPRRVRGGSEMQCVNNH